MIEVEIPHLRRYARALVREREAADDLVQDTLERAWRKRHLWRPSGRLRSWLFRILYRQYLDMRPRRQPVNHKLIALEDMVTELPSVLPPQQSSLHCRDVLQAINRLTDKHRAVLMLVALEQPSYDEGARMLGLRVGTFRSRLSRARERLEEQLIVNQEPSSDGGAQKWASDTGK
jgi:RNA polymerase sigma-70 factor (ECF subfamily)